MFEKLSFAHLLGAVLALSFIVGFAVFVLSGATTNKGTTGAIGSESATIMSAEKASCSKYGTYASIVNAAQRGIAHVQAGLQLGGVPAREGLRDDRYRLACLPIAGRLKEPHFHGTGGRPRSRVLSTWSSLDLVAGSGQRLVG